MSMFIRVLCLTVSLLLTGASAYGQRSVGSDIWKLNLPPDRNSAPENAGDSSELSLRGLPGVYVLVEDLDDDAKRAGLDRDQIQTDVELKRRLAGIKILTRSESLLVPGGAYLYVRPTIVLGNGLCIFSVEVALHQGVLLERDNAILVYGASTWSKGNVGATWQSIAASTIRSQIADKVDKFLNAYLAVNPKK